jgi:hypothetical protein
MEVTMKRVLVLAAVSVVGAAVLVAPFAALSTDPAGRDVFKLLLGQNQDELCNDGLFIYPEEGMAHNRAGHRLAARRMTDRYGVLVTLTAGAANEVVEGLSQAAMGLNPFRVENVSETLGDLGANWRGVKDSLVPSRANAAPARAD